jgi:hypothetical protein
LPGARRVRDGHRLWKMPEGAPSPTSRKLLKMARIRVDLRAHAQ